MPSSSEAALKRSRQELLASPSTSTSEREALLLLEVGSLREQLAAANVELSRLRAVAPGEVVGGTSTLLPPSLAALAMDTLSEGITIADVQQPDAPLIYANDGFCRMTGYSLEETVGHNCRFLQGQGTDPATITHLRTAISLGQPVIVELKNFRKDGTPFINQLSLMPIRAADGTVTHFVGIQCDVTQLHVHRETEMIALKQAAEAAAATEAKSRFLAHMSHEIRTPLNGILAVGQMLAETTLNEEQTDLVGTIRMSGETLLNLICDILDFSRIEAQKLLLHHLPFDLEETLERALNICSVSAAKKHINVAYTVDKNVPRSLVGDAGRLQQVLLNALVNGLKFTPAGGSLSLRCSLDDVLGDEGERDGNITQLHIAVTDTGIGISKEGLTKLFACFSQVDNESMPNRKYDGAGLGLAISRRLCEAMGGSMYAESNGPGCGSVFHIVVRLQTAEPQLRDMSGRSTVASFLSGRRFLIADACEPVRFALARWLVESWGASEVAAVDSAEALDQALGYGGAFNAVFAESTTPMLRVAKAYATARRGAPTPPVFALTWPAVPANYSAPGLPRPSSFSGCEKEEDDKKIDDPALACPEEILPDCINVPKPLRQSRLYTVLVARFAPELQPVAPRPQPLKDSVSAASLAELERAASAPVAQLGDAGASGRASGALRVLLAEDHAINQKVVIGLLKRYGHRVTCVAHDGVDALEKLRVTDGGPNAFDVILMDLHMPRMGGIECASAIASEWPHCHTPIIAVTADAFEESRQRCLSGGFAGWLSKPFRVDGMLAVLEEVTGAAALE